MASICGDVCCSKSIFRIRLTSSANAEVTGSFIRWSFLRPRELRLICIGVILVSFSMLCSNGLRHKMNKKPDRADPCKIPFSMRNCVVELS